MNPYALIGLLAAGVGAAWFFSREAEASEAESSGPVWRYAVTNQGEQGTVGIWEVWIEEPNKPAYPLGGAAGTDFPSYAAGKNAAVAYIQSRGATPVEKTV